MRTLTVPEKHCLKCARDTMRTPPEMRAIMGMTTEQALKAIKELAPQELKKYTDQVLYENIKGELPQ